MKNKNLKICFAIIMSFAVCSLKAQTLQQKFQKDNEERKKQAIAIRLKAKEQQAQQQSEKINGPGLPQNTGSGNSVQTDKPIVPQEKKEQTKPSISVKKTEPIQQAILRKKEDSNQIRKVKESINSFFYPKR